MFIFIDTEIFEQGINLFNYIFVTMVMDRQKKLVQVHVLSSCIPKRPDS